MEGVHFNYVTNDLGIQVAERTEQGNANWSMDGFVTGSVVNASCSSDSYYDWNEIFADYKNAIVSTLGAFSFDKSDVEAECAACSAVMAKYTSEILTGTLDIDEKLPTIQDELKKAGIEAIQAEAQRQLDEYLATQQYSFHQAIEGPSGPSIAFLTSTPAERILRVFCRWGIVL